MPQICVPLPPLDEPRAVDVELTIDGVKQRFHYRVETLVWADYGAGVERADALKQFLDGREPGWHLVAIGPPSERSVPVLLRFRPRPLVQPEPAL